MTVSTHEMTILCLIEMTEDPDSLEAIVNAAVKRRNTVKQDNWTRALVQTIEEGAFDETKKKLYTWAWINGGYNQHYAHTEAEAIEYAETMCDLVPNMNTFKHEPNDTAYWNNLPLFD